MVNTPSFWDKLRLELREKCGGVVKSFTTDKESVIQVCLHDMEDILTFDFKGVDDKTAIDTVVAKVQEVTAPVMDTNTVVIEEHLNDIDLDAEPSIEPAA